MNLEIIKVKQGSKLRNAIKAMDNGGIGIVFVVDNNDHVVGLITNGDFRRKVLQGISLDVIVDDVMNMDFYSVKTNETEKQIINIFLSQRIDILPVIENGKLKDILNRSDFNLEGKITLPEVKLDIPVIIMAGGKGTRMKPFTNILPKPLIPIGERSMLEVIMDEYIKFGFDDFYLTINYKGNLIKAYFEDAKKKYNLSYIEEHKFLGTAGALKLLQINKRTPIFVSNCDILIKEDYLSILDFHRKGKYDLTLVAAMIHHKVPYGICKIKNEGELDYLSEKPEYDYLVNSGMYILNSSVLDLIPVNEFFHITHLMEKIKQNGGKVGVYPVSEKSWIDVGQWEEYIKTSNFLKNV